MSDVELSALLGELLDYVADEAGLVVSVEAMQYQGFDPKALLAHIYALAREAERDVKKDLMTMAVIGTMRGSNLKTIKGKSSAELVSFLNDMVTVYGLAGGRPASAKTVTLIRVSALMAAPIAKAIHVGNLAIPTTISPTSIAPGFPAAMCIPTFGSLIPPISATIPEVDVTLIRDAFAYHQVKFDAVINSNKRERTSLDKIFKYIEIQYNSQLYSEADRIKVLKAIGILKPTGGITPTIRAALKVAQDALADLRG